MQGTKQLINQYDAAERDQLAGREPIGVVDIGSNSVRLVIYDGAVRSPTPLFNEKEQCGLGRSVATTGALGEAGVATTLATLARFHALTRLLRVKNVRAFATAAVREASDGAAFLTKAEKALGFPIQLLSGEREAQLASLGIAMGFVHPDGVTGDLGGGSLELVDLEGEQRCNAITLPLGGLRLIDITANRFEEAMAVVDQQLASIPWASRGRGRPFYAVGGTWRAIAKLHMAHFNYPLRVLQGYSLPARDAIRFCDLIVKDRKRLQQIKGMETVSRSRREVLPLGALVLGRLLQHLGSTELVTSVYGIREGALYDLLPSHLRSQDPLLFYCDELAQLRSRSPEHAREIGPWTDAIFGAKILEETADERRLRYAACLLSDMSWRTSPDFRGEESINAIAHSTMTGIEHPGRIFLALTVYLRHVGPGAPLESLAGRVKGLISIIQKDRHAVRRARILAAAIRLAHMISIGQPGIIDETPLMIEDEQLVLSMPPAHASLDGPRLRRRLNSLARLLSLKPFVRFSR